MFSSEALTRATITSSLSRDPSLPSTRPRASLVSCSLGTRKVPVERLRYQSRREPENGSGSTVGEGVEGPARRGGGKAKGISGIHVPRQKHISVSKAELVDAIVSMFEPKEDADEFVRLAKCLDSILHAEHKQVLEEMRIYYSHTHSQKPNENSDSSSARSEDSISNSNYLSFDASHGNGTNSAYCDTKDEDDKMLNFHDSFDLRSMFLPSSGVVSRNAVAKSRLAVATHFQRAFMQLLHDARFEELSAQDLLLTYALNNDYLLTLPIYVDWKRASDSNAIIFKRGYATERQKGRLIVEKLDYLQSKLLQEIFIILSRPLKRIGSWLNEALKGSSNAHDMQIWIEKMKLWLKEQFSVENTLPYIERMPANQLESEQIEDSDLPIWLAAQRAIPRYEGFLSSVGPRGRLIRKLLSWIGILPSLPETSLYLDKDIQNSELSMRPNFLPRITLSNIWEPASRESCGNSAWKMFKSSISILFSRSVLQEPAFQELILLYTDELNQNETAVKEEVLPVQLKIYERIPIPDLSVIFPHKKLSFRILDMVRLDIASILGLLAFFVNYKFENIASSPSAVLLDVIAISGLVIYVIRVVLGYKRTTERYQLLVNKTLYEKTLASGFGSVHFLLDASEQQQFKEAILVYAVVLNSDKYLVQSRSSVKDACERFMYDNFKEKIEMPIDKAMDTLMRLDLLVEFPLESNLKLKAIPCSIARESLKKRWDSLLGQNT